MKILGNDRVDVDKKKTFNQTIIEILTDYQRRRQKYYIIL